MNTTTADIFELESLLVVATVKTLDVLFAEENGSDAVALYFFYYRFAKKQRTNQVRTVDIFCMKGLGWGETRFRLAKAILKKYGLISNVKSGAQWYIKINYMKKSTTPQKEVLASEGTNALSKLITQNALSKLSSKEDNRNPDVQELAKAFTDLTGLSSPTDDKPRYWLYLFARNKPKSDFPKVIRWLQDKGLTITKAKTIYKQHELYVLENKPRPGIDTQKYRIDWGEDGGRIVYE